MIEVSGDVRETQEIKVRYLNKDPRPITINPKGDWIDLYAADNIFIPYQHQKLIPLGVAMKLPDGYEAHLLPRSSTFKNYGIIMANSMGIIDNSYCGDDDEWMFSAICASPRMYRYKTSEAMPFDEKYKLVDKSDPIYTTFSNTNNLTFVPIKAITNGFEPVAYWVQLDDDHIEGFVLGSVIHKDDKIAQFRIVKKMPAIHLTEVPFLGYINRGGFGSTGN